MENHQVALEAASLARPQLNSFYFSFFLKIKAIVSTLGLIRGDLKQLLMQPGGCAWGRRRDPGVSSNSENPFWVFFFLEKKDCGVSERERRTRES